VVGDANSFKEKVQNLHMSLFGFNKKVHLNHCGFEVSPRILSLYS
jgi:hypothetical protein